MSTQRAFFHCGGCDQYHPFGFTGDCRDDANRFSPEDLPEGWREVSETPTMADFIADQKITMTHTRTDSNPHMDGKRHSPVLGRPEMDHWRVTLKRPGAKMTTYFSKGLGHHGKPPTAEEVLDCLASDSASVEQNSFSDFCAELGYDEDSRSAYRTYEICSRQADRLRKFLGDQDAYESLLYKTDRL